GLLGVGGGVLFVPGLVLFLKLGQHQAEATSLLAIVPVAIVGTIRQDRYGNVRRDDAVVMGALSLAGAIAGVALANTLSGQALRVAFAILILVVAAQLVRSTLWDSGDESYRSGADGGGAPGSPDTAADRKTGPTGADSP
ncbi:MAG TPA: sulfite exporter TauE/SafE family protein, partial [Solirubrobacteraceae bacterium]|nr:sulfite exporter TauE/SafE family protein [Solirubrobacteraceae bacterium]